MGVVLDAAEAVSQAADLSDDQVDEGVDQLIKDLQVLVLLEAAETLSEDKTQKKQETLKSQSKWLQSFLSRQSRQDLRSGIVITELQTKIPAAFL